MEGCPITPQSSQFISSAMIRMTLGRSVETATVGKKNIAANRNIRINIDAEPFRKRHTNIEASATPLLSGVVMKACLRRDYADWGPMFKHSNRLLHGRCRRSEKDSPEKLKSADAYFRRERRLNSDFNIQWQQESQIIRPFIPPHDAAAGTRRSGSSILSGLTRTSQENT